MVSGSNYTDFRIVHDVTDWTDMKDYVFGPIARTTTPGLGTTDGYLLILNSADKDFQLLRIDGEVPDDTELGNMGGHRNVARRRFSNRIQRPGYTDERAGLRQDEFE